MIQLVSVTRRHHRGMVALDDVSLDIGAGELVFVTGPSGAGKSTLLRLLFREESPTAGLVVVAGKNLSTLRESEVMAYRREVGFVFQDFRLLPDKSVEENLGFVLRALGVPRDERRARAFDALRRVGLPHALRQFPRELSGGEQQRIAIARALIPRPRLILADEPTGSLDPELARRIMQLFRELNSRGTTIVIASHDRALIREMRRRTLTLEDGRLVADTAA